MRLSSYAAWFLDDDHTYRQPILFVWVIAVPLVAGQAFLWFNAPWSIFARTGASLVTAAVLLGTATVVSFLIREDY